MPSESVSPQLQALDFTADIKRLTEDFVGREWIVREIDAWLSRPGALFFILTGEAGIGKSTIAARLTQIRDDIAAYHFCIAGQNSTIVPGTVLCSIAAQLGQNLDGYGEALANTINPTYVRVDVKIHVGTMNGGHITGVVLENLPPAESKEELQILLTAPLSAMPAPARPILIMLDSLDEAMTFKPDDRSGDNLVTLLAGLGNLPPWVRIILTSRPEQRVLTYFATVPRHVVAAESQMNRDDLRRYVIYRVGKRVMRARLRVAPKPVKLRALVDQVAGIGDEKGLADGNFLYTKILLNDVESGTQPLDDLAALPKSLDEIYQRFLLRLEREWETRYQPLLAILAVAREPLTREQLLQFGDQSARLIGGQMSATLVNHSVGELLQFLDARGAPGGEQYSLFHQSLRDYLGETSRSGRFACPPEDGHRAIANYYIEYVAKDWSSCDAYGRYHLPLHAMKANKLSGLLNEPEFWINAEPAGLRNALEATRNLSEHSREVSLIFSLVYPDLLNEVPATRAAVLHLAALKQAAASVAAFFEPVLVGSDWRARWTSTAPRLIPYRQRKTGGRVKALAAAIVNGSFTVVTLEESASTSEDLLSIWAPIEDEVRSTAIPRFSLPGIGVIEVGAQRYIEIRSMRFDSTNLTLVALDSLQTSYSGWNFAITVWADADRLYTAEADLAGAVYLRPLGSPAMFVVEGNLQDGITACRSPETKAETPIAQFDLRVGLLLPVGIGSTEPVIVGVDKGMRVVLLRPKQDQGRASVTQLTLGGGSPKLKEVRLQGMPVLAILVSAEDVLLVAPNEGRLLERITHRDMKALSDALHQIDLSLVETNDGIFFLIATQSSEVMFWDVARHRFTHKHVFDQLATADSIVFEERAFVLTGHTTSIQLWDAQQLTAATAQDPVEEVELITAAMVDGQSMVAMLSWVGARKSMRLTVRDGQTGKQLYIFERTDKLFRPFFLALGQTSEGPCVVLQSNWWSDIIEFHRFSKEEIYVDTQTTPMRVSNSNSVTENNTWWPEEIRNVNFELVCISTNDHFRSQPSRALETFVQQIFVGIPGVDELRAETNHVMSLVFDPFGRGLAVLGSFELGQAERRDALICVMKNTHPALFVDLDNSGQFLRAAILHNGGCLVLMEDTHEKTLLLWQFEMGNELKVFYDFEPKSLFHLATVAPVLAIGIVAGQVLLAVGQNSGVTVIPVTEGPVFSSYHIPEQATAISFAPQDMLIIGTSHGVVALRLGREVQATNK